MNVQNITVAEEEIQSFCAKHEIVKLALFGSVLREDFNDSSDVDVLVEFAPHKRIGLYGFAQVEQELSELLGRKVDLNTPNSLSRYFREEVLAEAETLYVAP